MHTDLRMYTAKIAQVSVNRQILFHSWLSLHCGIPHYLTPGAISFQIVHLKASNIHVCICLSSLLGCVLPPALHPCDSIQADRWSRPVQDSEHERPILPPPFLQIIKPTLFPRKNALSSGGWMWRAAESTQGLTFPAESIPLLTAPLHPDQVLN